MSQPEIDRLSARRILSALADGDATDSEAQRAFQAWRDDGQTRADWHAYQLIGDVMRSDDLACSPSADQGFLVALRARLAAEPVVLAPVVPAAPAVGLPPHLGAAVGAVQAGARADAVSWVRSRWQAPLAIAAGFFVMMGGIGVVRPFWHSPGASGAGLANPLASASTGPVPGAAGLVPARLATRAAAGTPVAANAVANVAQVEADTEQLAPYLAAHRQSTMNGVFQMPGGDLRNVSLVQTAP